jgi:hypothetical protein
MGHGDTVLRKIEFRVWPIWILYHYEGEKQKQGVKTEEKNEEGRIGKFEIEINHFMIRIIFYKFNGVYVVVKLHIQ